MVEIHEGGFALRVADICLVGGLIPGNGKEYEVDNYKNGDEKDIG